MCININGLYEALCDRTVVDVVGLVSSKVSSRFCSREAELAATVSIILSADTVWLFFSSVKSKFCSS